MQTTEDNKTAEPAKASTPKWQTQVGPRLTKQVETALREINYQHGFYKEKTGIIGVSEKEWAFHVIFGGRREDVAAAWQTLGDKYGWTITRANMNAVIAEATALVESLKASAPVQDKRITAEQDAADKERMAVAEQAREKKAAEETQARMAQTAQWRSKYPWAIQEGGSAKRGAANLKTLLQQTFPGQTFSVTSDRNSIDIRWNDGPTYAAVKDLADPFHTGYYDSHSDCHLSKDSAFNVWMGGANYGGCSRHISEPLEKAIAEGICALHGQPMPDWSIGKCSYSIPTADGERLNIYEEAHRLLKDVTIPPGATFKAIESGAIVFNVPEVPPVTATPASTSASGATVRRNLEHNGVEVSFPSKPDASVISELKAAGFRWSLRSKVWYKKYGGYSWAQAHRIAGIDLPAEPPAGPDAHDMAIEDQMAESAGVGGLDARD